MTRMSARQSPRGWNFVQNLSANLTAMGPHSDGTFFQGSIAGVTHKNKFALILFFVRPPSFQNIPGSACVPKPPPPFAGNACVPKPPISCVAVVGIIMDGSISGGAIGVNSRCSSTTGSATGSGEGWLTAIALFVFFFFFGPHMQAKGPSPQSESSQQHVRMPNKIQSAMMKPHKALADESFVVVVSGGSVCAS